MNESRTKAIPLRRTRAAGGLTVSARLTEWRDRVGQGAQLLAAPPRQVWLAALGSVAFTARTTQALWVRAVTEGESVERWLHGLSPENGGGRLLERLTRRWTPV